MITSLLPAQLETRTCLRLHKHGLNSVYLIQCLFLIYSLFLCVAYGCAVVDEKDHTTGAIQEIRRIFSIFSKKCILVRYRVFSPELTLSLAAPFAPPCLEALGLIGPRKKEKKTGFDDVSQVRLDLGPPVESHCYSSLPPPSPSGFPIFIFHLSCL